MENSGGAVEGGSVWVGEEEVPSGTWRRVCRAVGEAAGWCGARMGEARAASAHADGSRGRGGLSVGLYTLFFIFYILFRSDFQPEYKEYSRI